MKFTSKKSHARLRTTVTIADQFAARHFSFSHKTKIRLSIALIILLPAMLVAIPYNYMQFMQRLNLQQAHDTLNSAHRELQTDYAARENYYDKIKSRVELLEWSIGPQENPAAAATLEARVNNISFSVLQDKIMQDSIPNGSPLKGKRKVTSGYGDRIHPVTRRKSFHNGIDFRARRDQVFATADGLIKRADYSKLSGNTIIITHNFGFESYYAHLHKMQVKQGDIISKGQVLGISGDSGRHSTGPHLHYEIRYLGRPLDPKEFVNWQPGSDKIFNTVKAIKWQSLIKLINQQITHPTLQLSQMDVNLKEK